MRVKQTARKSTTMGTSSQQSDPVRSQMRALLQTKRKSATPSVKRESQASSTSSIASGMGKGKKIQAKPYRRGRPNDDDDERVRQPPRQTRSDMRVLKEINSLNRRTNPLIAKAPFHRLVREITQAVAIDRDERVVEGPGFKYQVAALEALQEAAEFFMSRLFEDAYLCTLHAKRVTLFVQDMRLCQRLQNIPGLQKSIV